MSTIRQQLIKGTKNIRYKQLDKMFVVADFSAAGLATGEIDINEALVINEYVAKTPLSKLTANVPKTVKVTRSRSSGILYISPTTDNADTFQAFRALSSTIINNLKSQNKIGEDSLTLKGTDSNIRAGHSLRDRAAPLGVAYNTEALKKKIGPYLTDNAVKQLRADINKVYKEFSPELNFKTITKRGSRQRIKLSLKTKGKASRSGGESTKLRNRLATEVEQAFDKYIRLAEKKGFSLEALASSPVSKAEPSFIEKVTAIIDKAFTGISGIIKKAPKKISTKSTSSGGSIELPKPKPNFSVKSKTPEYKTPNKPASTLDIVSLLNYRLHDKIQENMGDGGSKTVLNYRTGRFAKTAAVVSVTNNRQESLMVYYDYMKYPYATFDPGGAQYKPYRAGPIQIIDKSIRELAIELLQHRFSTVTPIVV